MTSDNQNTALPSVNARGAQPGNQNRHRHGLRAGSLPKGCAYIQRQTDELRMSLEQAIVAAKGQVDLVDAASVNTACRAERLAQLASRWLRLHAETMSHDQRLSYAREVVKASEQRDRAIRVLGIDAKSVQEFQIQRLYSDPWPTLPPPTPPETSGAEPIQETHPRADAAESLPGGQVATCEGNHAVEAGQDHNSVDTRISQVEADHV